MNKRKRILSIVVTLMMCITMIPMPVHATTATSVIIGNQTLNSGNPSLPLGSGNASFDVSTGTLTLTNATMNEAGTLHDTYYHTLIYAEGDLIINLVGDNTLTNTSPNRRATIYIDEGDLTFTGDGNLTIYNSGVSTPSEQEYGIYQDQGNVDKGLVLADTFAGTININSDGSTGYSNAGVFGARIHSYGGTLNITAGPASGGNADSFGILTYGLYVDGGTIVANGGNAADRSAGAFISYGGPVVVTSGSVTLMAGTSTNNHSVGLCWCGGLNLAAGMGARGGDNSTSTTWITGAYTSNAYATDGSPVYFEILPAYKVTYNANGGSGTMAPSYVAFADASTPITLTANGFTAPSGGSTFIGWNEVASGTGTPYTDGASVTLSSDLQLFAQWGVPPTYNLSVTAPTFENVTTGYTRPAAAAITISNTGNSTATISDVSLSGPNSVYFTLDDSSAVATVASGGTNTTYTIQPDANLAAGTYTATITVTYDGGATASGNVSFTVSSPTPAPTTSHHSTTDTTTTITTANTSNADSSATDGSKTVQTTKNNDGTLEVKTTEKGTTVNDSGEKVNTVVETTEKLDKDGTGTVESKTTETVKNAEGEVTATVVTESTGTVSTAADGSKTTVTTNTTTTTDANGATTTTVTKETMVETVNGTVAGTVADESGKTIAYKAKISEKTIKAAAKADTPVVLPVTAQSSSSEAKAIPVEITVPKDSKAFEVEIPVKGVTETTVPVLVKPDGTTEIVKASIMGDEGVIMQVDSGVTVKMVDNEKTFTDVKADIWYAPYVNWASSREVMNGTAAQTFSPNLPTSRSMVAQLIYNLDGGKTGSTAAAEAFSDVKAGQWFTDAVAWMVNSGIAKGQGNAFGVNNNISREELAVMLYNYAKFKGYDVSASGSIADFSDNEKVSSWAKDAMAWAVGAGLLDGMKALDGSMILNAGGAATRAQIAAIVQRFCENVIL